MGHVLIFLHKLVAFKLIAILLTLTMVALLFQLSTTFKAHALNVHTEIKASPPGIARIIDRTGEPPPGIVNPRDNTTTPFTTDSDGDSGTVLPGGTPPDDNGNTPPDETGPTPPEGNQPTPPDETGFIPPGIARIFGLWGGGPMGGGAPVALVNPQSGDYPALTINSNIEFEMTFPGETHQGEFTVSLFDTDPSPDGFDGSFTRVEYELTLEVKAGGYQNLENWLTVVRDSTENDLSSDNLTSASLDSSQNPADTSDRWEVTLTLPDDPPTGDYWTTITVLVTSTTP